MMNFELPDVGLDDAPRGGGANLPDVVSSDSEPEPSPRREMPEGHPPARVAAALETTSCPFAALSMALESGANTDMLNGGAMRVPSTKRPSKVDHLPTIDQNSVSTGEAPAGPELKLNCPVSGTTTTVVGKRNDDDARSFKSASSNGSRRSAIKSVTGRSQRSARSRGSASGSSKNRFVDQKQSRMKRRVGRKSKPPPFDDEDVKKFAPIIRNSWARIMELKGYFELGNLYYDTLFEMAPELRPLFTLDRSEMGIKFVDMLASMVAVIDSPPKLHQKLEDLSPMHIRKGVQASYMPQMGAVLFAVLQSGLESEFTAEMKEAWGWVWEWLTKSMALTLAGAGQNSSLVIMSWDMALENHADEELGGMMYDTLIKTAPNLKSIFSRPRQVMAMKFVDMITTVVSFADDAERMQQQVRWLGVRHVKYGAKPGHVSIVGQVLLSVMEEAVAEEWTPEMEKAWSDLWTSSCEAMMAAIKDAEQHGEGLEDVWKTVKKKTKPARLGATVVQRMLKMHPELVAPFTQAYHAAKEREEASGDGKGAEADEHDRPRSGIKKKFSDAAAKFSRRRKGNTELDVPDVGGDEAATGSHSDLKGGKDSSASDFNRDDAEEAFGNETWKMLETVMTLLWEPEQLNEKLIVIGNRWHAFGVRLVHMEAMSDAVHEALRIALACPCNECGKDEWKSHISDAWRWLWETVCQSMVNTIESNEADHPKLAKISWEAIKKRHTPEQIGDALFTELTREAPHVVHLFKRPKKLQAFMFMQAIDTLVEFAQSPAAFFDDLRTFTIRHIKYGVKSEFVKPFGKAVLQGIEDLAADDWSKEAANAWNTVWIMLSSCVARSLNVGTNLITVSLVNGDLDRMQEAAECAPRGERIAWLTRVELNGTIMSPLYWAIRDGKFSLAEFMIQDVLAMRADRECYYYGREDLFERHPDLVSVLCKDCPELVRTMLDGLMWHSQTVLDGQLRVNYYLKELYGDPEKVPDAWKSDLAVLCLDGQPDMFVHPVLNKLLELKWLRFGQKMFLAVQAFFVILIALFTTAFLKFRCDCTVAIDTIRIVTGTFSCLAWLFMTWIMFRQSTLGQTKHMELWGAKISVPRLMMNEWNVIRYICMTTTTIAAFDTTCLINPDNENFKLSCEDGRRADSFSMIDYSHPYSWDMILLSVSALLMWGQLLQVIVISDQLATLSFAVGRLFPQVARNLLIVVIIMVAFACGLNALQEPNFETIEIAIIDLMRITLSLQAESHNLLEKWGLALLVFFVIMVQLGMFSILIAQMVKGYNDLSHEQEGNSKMNRAFQCVEMESFLPISTRTRFYREMGFDQPIEFDNGDEGPAGGIQCLELAAVRATPYYNPDRIKRCTGTASALDPWPPEANIRVRENADDNDGNQE